MPARVLNIVDYLVIHCSASPNGRWNTAADIDAWHRDRGFARDMTVAPLHEPTLKHIGYHFVIGTNGALWNGRSLAEAGAHAIGFNQRSIGICQVGTDRFTADQWAMLRRHVCAMVRLIAANRRDAAVGNNPIEPAVACEIAERLKIRLVGHRDLPVVNKTCPGFDVSTWLSGGMQPLPDHLCAALPHA
ncbi:MAG: N-acetylmuramoyl-L-alanine amidase [Gammaproteobacteria bacterium]|nr:N-acetylmuramoyl-L-alanine amidase [Gammaproteobacteria bacterium]